MAVGVGGRIKAASQLVLSFRGKVLLPFDEDDVVRVKSGAKESKCIIYAEEQQKLVFRLVMDTHETCT